MRSDFQNFEAKLAEAKVNMQQAQNKIHEGKPMDAQLKSAEARLKSSQKHLEQRQSAQQEAQQQLEEAMASKKSADKLVEDAKERLDNHKKELASLQRKSAEQVEGNMQATTPSFKQEHSAMLIDILNQLAPEALETICRQRGINKQDFVDSTNSVFTSQQLEKPTSTTECKSQGPQVQSQADIEDDM